MRFDAAKAAKAINFFELVLRYSKGAYAGQPFKLLPWQHDVIARLFGCVGEDGFRTYREFYGELPKKSGKSELAAGIALYMLVADGEAGAEVYSAAANKEQAGNVFRVAMEMVRKSPMLSKQLRIIESTKTIHRRDEPLSFYKAIAADGEGWDGINPHCVIGDELHRWKSHKSMELYDVLTKGSLMRRQPLFFGITTAGVRAESPLCWRLHEAALRTLGGSKENPRLLPRIFTIPAGMDWKNPLSWRAANPSHEEFGGFIRQADLEGLFQKALADPVEEIAFKRYHLNVWGERENRAINMDLWREGGGELRTLVGRPCWLGVDLSSTTDLSSLVAIFPSDDRTFDILPFFWMARDLLLKQEKQTKQPYRAWAQAGYLQVTEGNIIDYRAIQKKIDWMVEVFDVREIGIDPRFAGDFTAQLIEQGRNAITVPPNFGSLSGPTQLLLDLYQSRRFRHGAHPILDWNAACCDTRSNGNEGIMFVKPDRKKSDKRIDGIAACVNALAMWLKTGVEQNEPSITVMK